MAVLINFKICDNDKACSGMSVCPRNVFSWNQETENLEINNDLCINCGLCEKACMVYAIKVAKNEEEYKKISKEIENDPRSTNDLLIDRYGAKPIDLAMICEETKINEKIKAKKAMIIEVYNEDSIMCLLKSIPVKEIADKFNLETRYRKVEAKTKLLLNKYNIKELPALLFFKNGKFLNKIEGYIEENNEKELYEKIDKMK